MRKRRTKIEGVKIRRGGEKQNDKVRRGERQKEEQSAMETEEKEKSLRKRN